MDRKYISDNKRVILITGDHTKWYEQAIFIVRKNAPEKNMPTDFIIREAEMVINNYMSGLAARTPKSLDDKGDTGDVAAVHETPSKPKAKKQRTKFDTVVNALIIFAAATLLILLYRSFV